LGDLITLRVTAFVIAGGPLPTIEVGQSRVSNTACGKGRPFADPTCGHRLDPCMEEIGAASPDHLSALLRQGVGCSESGTCVLHLRERCLRHASEALRLAHQEPRELARGGSPRSGRRLLHRSGKVLLSLTLCGRRCRGGGLPSLLNPSDSLLA